jgi:hypothetical protein
MAMTLRADDTLEVFGEEDEWVRGFVTIKIEREAKIMPVDDDDCTSEEGKNE